MAGKHTGFAQLLEHRIQQVVQQRFVCEALTEETIRCIRDVVRDVVTDVFARSSQRLSFEALVWASDQHFKLLRVNDQQLMGDLVVINEYKLSEMPYSDIELLRGLFGQTVLGPDLEREHQRRSLT